MTEAAHLQVVGPEDGRVVQVAVEHVCAAVDRCKAREGLRELTKAVQRVQVGRRHSRKTRHGLQVELQGRERRTTFAMRVRDAPQDRRGAW